MNRKWTRAICTVLTSALVFTGPAVEGTTFSGYINSGLEKVYAKTQKQKDDKMWDIAKRYRTTVENIMEINALTSDSIKPDDRLIIARMPV